MPKPTGVEEIRKNFEKQKTTPSKPMGKVGRAVERIDHLILTQNVDEKKKVFENGGKPNKSEEVVPVVSVRNIRKNYE